MGDRLQAIFNVTGEAFSHQNTFFTNQGELEAK